MGETVRNPALSSYFIPMSQGFSLVEDSWPENFRGVPVSPSHHAVVTGTCATKPRILGGAGT